MGIETFPRYPSSFIDHKSPARDPCAILEIVNPDRGCLTCVGYAPSQRRRCRNPIAAGNVSCVYQMLEALANTSPHSRSVESQLKQIAALSLCRRYHQNQVDSVVDQWLSRISLMERPPRRRQSSLFDSGGLDTHYARPKATGGSSWESGSSASYAPEGTSRTSNSNCQACQDDTEVHQQREERRRREQKRREKEWAEEGRQERERQEQKRREKKQAEEERQEREREARAEQERKNEKLTQQAAQRKREERQKQAQMKAEQERKVWDQAWEDYVKGWAVFKENKQKTSRDSIPWPVRSGRRADVSEANVKVFFQKAPPDASVPTKMFKIMSIENLKWHPDKTSPVFGGESPEDVIMICRIVIQLRVAAQQERNKG